MQRPLDRTDGVIQVETFTLSNGQRISFLITAKGPSCCRTRPDSYWEPIGDENTNLAIALNRFVKVGH